MTRPVPWLRLLLCLLIGTCASAQILAMLHFPQDSGGVTLAMLDYTPLLAFTYSIFMVPTGLLIGLPGFLVLRRLNWLNAYAVIGMGTVAGSAWVLPLIGSSSPPYALAFFFALGGFLASGIFWLTFRFRNKSFRPSAAERHINHQS